MTYKEDILGLSIIGIIIAVILLVIMGNASVILIVNNAMTGVCNSGWPLATLFSPSNGIVTLLILFGFLIALISVWFFASNIYKQARRK